MILGKASLVILFGNIVESEPINMENFQKCGKVYWNFVLPGIPNKILCGAFGSCAFQLRCFNALSCNGSGETNLEIDGLYGNKMLHGSDVHHWPSVQNIEDFSFYAHIEVSPEGQINCTCWNNKIAYCTIRT